MSREENDLFSNAAQEKSLLLDALIEYYEKKNRSATVLPASSNVKCSWTDVAAALQQLSTVEEDENSRFKRSVRKIGDNADIFQRWLALLPDGDYGATISGAFKLILGVSTCSTITARRLINTAIGCQTSK
jgi:hypothetical protein